jgi:glycosyltransferase involved in cell wall biosynthesis
MPIALWSPTKQFFRGPADIWMEVAVESLFKYAIFSDRGRADRAPSGKRMKMIPTLTPFESVGRAPNDLSLSVVVPCYNQEDGLQELHRRTAVACRSLVAESYELILVDDGSRDKTWPGITALFEQNPHVVGVKLSRNYGHQLALSAGLSIVRGNLVLIIDDDLQDPPELMRPMYDLMRETSADVVYGQRRSRAGETRFKTKTAALFYRLLSKATDLDIPLDTGDFRLMTRRVADILAHMPERDRFIRGMVAWLGFRQVPFLYDRDPRFAGTTQYTFRKLLSFAVDAIVSFSILPLRIATYLGALLTLVLGIVGLYAIISHIISGIAPGWASLVLLIVGASAAQLMVLGVIGEYVGRIYLQSKQRPLFLIADLHRTDWRVSQLQDSDAGRNLVS